MPSSEPNTTAAVLRLQLSQEPALGLHSLAHQPWAVDREGHWVYTSLVPSVISCDREGYTGLHKPGPISNQLRFFKREGVVVFRCVPIAEPAKLKWTVPNPRSAHSLVKPWVTKQTQRYGSGGICRMRRVKGGGESDQRAFVYIDGVSTRTCK